MQSWAVWSVLAIRYIWIYAADVVGTFISSQIQIAGGI